MDWVELNPDLLRQISKKLGDISNFVRFRAVCKNWRLVVGPRDCPPQLPWLIEHRTKPDDSSYRKLFSLYSNTTHTLRIPQAKEVYILGSPSRYILRHDYLNHSASLFNPLTRSQSIPPIDHFTIIFPNYIGPDLNPKPSLNENGDIAVLFLYKTEVKISSVAFWRFVDRQLTKIAEIEVPHPKAIACFKGRLFIFDRASAETRVFDVTTGDEVLVIPPPPTE
ncbi:hypothetical protein LUZ60_007130 [Juncus effusus]|nr:hypothetical protein LUZ60_007130 [Juncus effusus]